MLIIHNKSLGMLVYIIQPHTKRSYNLGGGSAYFSSIKYNL